MLGDVFFVSDHDDGSTLRVETVQDVEDLLRRREVEVARRLVDEQHLRIADQGPGDRHALHLAAGQLAGIVIGPVGQTDGLKRGLSAPQAFGAPHASIDEWRGHVLERGRAGQQVVELEDEAEEAVAQLRPAGIVEGGDVVAGEEVGAGVGAVQQAENVEKVDFPEPERPVQATHSPRRTARSRSLSTGTANSPRRYVRSMARASRTMSSALMRRLARSTTERRRCPPPPAPA